MFITHSSSRNMPISAPLPWAMIMRKEDDWVVLSRHETPTIYEPKPLLTLPGSG